jgi:hypothetical protein
MSVSIRSFGCDVRSRGRLGGSSFTPTRGRDIYMISGAKMALTLTTRFKYSQLNTLVLRAGYGWGQFTTSGNVCTLTCDKGIKRPPAEIESIREINRPV